MDLFDLLEHQIDELEEEQHYIRRIPRFRVYNVRVDYFLKLDDQEFFARFRLSKSAVNYVHNLIKHRIKTKTLR